MDNCVLPFDLNNDRNVGNKPSSAGRQRLWEDRAELCVVSELLQVREMSDVRLEMTNIVQCPGQCRVTSCQNNQTRVRSGNISPPK